MMDFRRYRKPSRTHITGIEVGREYITLALTHTHSLFPCPRANPNSLASSIDS